MADWTREAPGCYVRYFDIGPRVLTLRVRRAWVGPYPWAVYDGATCVAGGATLRAAQTAAAAHADWLATYHQEAQ